MKTNLLRSLIALMLVVALLPLTGIAALAAEKPELITETDSMKGEADNDEMFAQYVENVFYKDVDGYSPPYSTGSHTAGSKLTGGAKVAYNELVPFIKSVAAGNRASTDYYFSNRVAVPASEYSEHVRLVISALLLDYPYEMYWFDKTAGWSYSIYYESDQAVVTHLAFSVASAYSAGSFQMNTAKASAPAKAAANAKAIVANNKSKSDKEKLVAYKKAVSDRVNYNYSALNAGTPYGDPWQLIWIFDGNTSTNVVCEGYSKGFQYLCDLTSWSSNVQCYSVTGRTSGPHMWNIVAYNGGRYLVDITNCDTEINGSYDDSFFMQLPASGSVANGYTLSNGLKYVYDSDTKNNWGTTILTLGAPKGVSITTQPKSVTVAKGATATVTVGASGDGLSYTWYVKAPGKTSFSKSAVTGKTYSVEMTAARNGTQLYCVVKDKYGNSVKSNTVTIKMKTALAITTQPKSVTVLKGATAKVTVGATGDGLTYAWYVKPAGNTSFGKSSITGNVYSVEMTASRNGTQLYCVVKDKYGNSVKSNTVTIKMKTPLAITTQPKSVTVAKGATAKVTVGATGDGLTYAWYLKAVGKTSFSKSSVTGNSYSVAMTAARSGNQLYCVVKDKYGNSVKTNTVTIKMKAPVAITTQPQSVTVVSGATAKVTVGATGDGLTYAWYLKAVGKSTFSKSSITGNTYSVTMTAARNGNQLYCVVKDKYGNSVKSNTVTIKMKAPITITTQPKSVTAAKGTTATVTIAASGEGLTYTWYVKPAGSSTFSRSTVTGKSYSVTMTAARNGNQLYCLVKDQKGNRLKSNTVTIKVPDPVVITVQPKSVTVARGETATVSVTAKGDGLTYAWYLRAVGKSTFSRSSVTSRTYSVTMTDARNGNELYCVVKDKYGNSVGSLTVVIRQEPITITTQPKSVTVAKGAAAKVSVTAVGSGLTYTWYVKLPGETAFVKSSVTGRAYAITMSEARNGTQLYCLIEDQYGNSVGTSMVTMKMSSSSANAIETTGLLAIENTDPQTVNLSEGGMHTMSITATGGTMPYSYQWYVNKGRGYEAVEGATNATYTTSPADHTSSGYSYYCVVADGSGNTVTGPVYTVLVAGEDAAPATGDNSLVELWAVLCIISAGACLMLMKRRKSER